MAKRAMALPRFSNSNVGNGTATNTHGARGGAASDESKNKKHCCVGAKGASKGKGEVDDITKVVDDQAAVELGQRGEDERANSEAKHVETHGHGFEGAIGDAKFVC